MQKSKVEKLIAKTQNAESSPFAQCSDSAKTFERAWNGQKKGQRN